MAGPADERAELERLRKLKRLRELEAKAAGAAPAQPASPFLQRAAGMLPEGTQPVFSDPQMRASLPAATAPDRMQNRTDSAVLAKARQVEADIADATRKARVNPVERAAGEVGRAETTRQLEGMSPFVAGMGGGNAAQLAGLAQSEQVYDEAGVMSAPEALSVRGVNSIALGIPGFVSEEMRGRIAQAGQDQPGASLAGDIAGYLAPGELAFQGGRAAYNATLKPLVNALLPQGGSALARGTRLGQRGTEQVGAWAGQNALFQGTVGESTAAAEEGRAPTLESALGKAEQGASDPINILGPVGLMALNRLGKFVTSGGRTATPDSVAEEVAQRTAGRSGSGTVLNAEALNGPVDRRAERILVRMLGEVGYRPNDIRAALATFDQLADQAADLPTLTSRLKDVLIDQLGPNAEGVLQKFLQGAGVSGGAASETVRNVVREDYGRLGQFLEDSANARLGAGSRYDTLTSAQQEMKRIGDEGYERVFSAPPTNPGGIDELSKALDFYSTSELATPLRQIAAGKMLNVEQMIKSDPRRAAHWMQMAANNKAQEAFDAGNTVLGNAYTDMRNNILSRLEVDGVAPGYQQARMQFGDEFGTEQALTFGSRFFTKVTDTLGVRRMADDLRNLTPEQQEAALLSIRDELLRLAGRHRKGAPPVTTQIGNEQSLGGLETVVGEKGGQLANDIRFIDERLARVRRIDPVTGKSSTIPSREALEEANRVVSNPMMRRIGNVMEALGGDAAVSSVAASVGSGAGGAVLPIFSLRAGMRSMGNALARGRQGKIDDVTALLMRDVGATPRGPMPGDDLPPLTARGGGGAPPTGGAQLAPASQPVPSPNALAPQGPIRAGEAGFVNYPVTNVLLGGSGGVTYGSFNDVNQDGKVNWEDQVGGAMIGIAGTTGLQKFADDAWPSIAAKLPKSSYDRIWNAESMEDFVRGQMRYMRPQRDLEPATSAEFDDAIEQAKTLMNRYSMAERLDLRSAANASDPEAKPIYLIEELASAILREQGKDPDSVLMPIVAQRDRNIDLEDFRISRNAKKEFAVATASQYEDAYRQARLELIPQNAKGPKRKRLLPTRQRVEDRALQILEEQGLDGSQFKVSGADKPENVVPLRPSLSSDPKQFGLPLRGDLGNALAGAGIGVGTDVNQDGERNLTDAAIGGGAMALAGRIPVRSLADDVATAGAGGKRPPKPDSPEAIKAAVRDLAKPKPEPTRLEQMVDAGKDASVPPVKSGTAEEDKLAAQATRMLERGDDVFKIHDKTGVVMIPYNNSNVPLYAPNLGPEEVIRTFYTWLREPAIKRPEWVNEMVRRSKRKSGLLLTDRNIAPSEMVPQPSPNALAEPPMSPGGFPVGAVVGGALGGAATGIAGGVAAIGGYQAYKDEQRKRNALAQ